MPRGAVAWHQVTSGPGRWRLVLRRKLAPSSIDAVSGATESTCPHSIRVVAHGYEYIRYHHTGCQDTPEWYITKSGKEPKLFDKRQIRGRSPGSGAPVRRTSSRGLSPSNRR